MRIGEGQVQAGLLRRGLGVCCSGGGGDFSEDLTDGRGVAFKVVAAREVLVKEGCCEGMHGRMCEHGAPAVDQGVGERVAGLGRLWCGRGASGTSRLHHSSVLQLQSQTQREEFGVG